MTGWERMARAFFPGMGKQIDSWNEEKLDELNRRALIRYRANTQELFSVFHFMQWELEMEEEDA